MPTSNLNGNRPRFTQKELIQALIDSGGIKLGAAMKLSCDRKTIWRYCKRYPKVEAAVNEALENTKDLAETQLIAAIGRGEAWAVCFFLKTRGKDRGYIERPKVDPDDAEGGGTTIVVRGGLPTVRPEA